jgi:tRNA(fMet)-specific endonuclease VapC
VTLWLLDTNIVSALIRDPLGKAALRVEAADKNTIFTSIIVACELRYGAEKRAAINLTERIEAALRSFDVQPLCQEADLHYTRLRCQLERRGTPIGHHDMLIAAHALALDATLVTANLREFQRIDGLKLENWLD